jgi:gliding motility-associated-like protein
VVELIKKLGASLALLLFGALCFAQAPTIHSSSVSITNLYCHYFTVTWSAGNGEGRVVLAREGSAVNAIPVDLTSYNARDSFGNGSQVGTGNWVVYNGSGSSFTLKNLKKNTTYHLAIFEYNSNGGNFEYYTESSYPKVNQRTENIVASATINQSYQCLNNNSYTFTNTSNNSKSLSMTYNWDFGDKTKSTATSPTHSYTDGGIFNVALKATATGCVTTVIIRDTVGVPFNANFELDKNISGNDSLQCYIGNYYTLINKFTTPPPIFGGWDRTNFKWYINDTLRGTQVDFKYGRPSWGAHTVKIVQARQVSKNGVFCYDSFEHDFYVLPPPIFDKDVSFSDTILCLNQKNFEFEHRGRDIQTTLWKFGDGSSSISNPASKSYNSIGKYRVQLDVKDINGCLGKFSDSVEVISTPNNFYTGLSPKYCINDPAILLTPSLTGGQFIYNGVNKNNDSTFNPNNVGKFVIEHVYSVGNCRDTFVDSTEVFPRPYFNLGVDSIICANKNINLNVPIAGLNYLWSTGATSQGIVATKGGIYWANADNGECAFRDTIVLKDVFPPTIELGNDTIICGGQSIRYSLKSDAGTVLWNDGSTEFARDLTTSGLYEVRMLHPCDTVIDQINLEILPYACEIFIPNVFSPNGDGLNDVFYPLGFFQFTDMLIFNEYGTKIFESSMEGIGWDGTYLGKDCYSTMYYFLIRYSIPDEGIYTKKVAKGSVFLMR